MGDSARLSPSGSSFGGFQSDRWNDSHVVLPDHDLQLFTPQGHSSSVSVSRRGTLDCLYMGSLTAFDCGECKTTAATTASVRHQFFNGSDAGRHRHVFDD